MIPLLIATDAEEDNIEPNYTCIACSFMGSLIRLQDIPLMGGYRVRLRVGLAKPFL